MLGKVFCLYLVLLLFLISVTLYAWLSGLNIKTLDIWREMILGLTCLLYFATLFYICNYAHYLSNIVRHQKTLYEYIYIYIYMYIVFFYLYYRLECKSQVSKQNIASMYKVWIFHTGRWALTQYSTNRN